MNVFVAISVAHHFVETKLIFSKEKRQGHVLRKKQSNTL